MSTKIVVSLKANHYASVYKFLWESLINIFGFFCQFYFSEKKYKKFLSSEEEKHAITHYKINYALIGVGFQLELVIQSFFFFNVECLHLYEGLKFYYGKTNNVSV